MVLNQHVARLAAVRTPGVAVRMTLGLAVLALGSGCHALGSRAPEPAPQAAPVARTAPPAEAGPESAIEAALAREASGAADTQTAATADVTFNSNAPKSYTVKRGDTLWAIAAMFLRDPWLWPEIWQVNPGVRNPHLIYPGDQLTLAYGANGQPQLRLVRGDALRVSPLVRSAPIDGPIATIPYEAIAAFLGRPSIVSQEDIKSAPHVVAMRDQHVVAGAGQDIYVKGLADAGAGRFNVVRVGEPLKDPENGKVLGYMGVYAASAQVDRPENISKARLVSSARETVAGDLLFAEELQSASGITPHAAPANVNGQIMAVVDGVQLIGQYQVVAVNRGLRHGLEVGHVLAIDQRGEVVPDASCHKSTFSWCAGKKVKLPDERAGTLLVFKTYDQMSYGLVVSAIAPVHVADQVRTP
ncbi:MAG: LysM domain-containing protein [Steroidobacteraceae bacterium]